MPNIKISEKKAQSTLEKGGMLDAYKYLITQLCKNGLPIGNLFHCAFSVSEELKELVKNNFRSEDEIRFREQQYLTWVSIIAATLIGILGIIF